MKLQSSILLLLLMVVLCVPAFAQGQSYYLTAQSGDEVTGPQVKTLELVVDKPTAIKWEVSLGLGEIWHLEEEPTFLIGTQPEQGDIVAIFLNDAGYLRKQGGFQAEPGTYYVTVKAGMGYRDAAGDIRKFNIYGDVRAKIYHLHELH